jgi:hypothetical protein
MKKKIATLVVVIPVAVVLDWHKYLFNDTFHYTPDLI